MKRKRALLRRILFLITLGLIAGLAVFLYLLFREEKQYREAKEEYEELQRYLSDPDIEGELPPEESYPHFVVDDFSLSSINPDYAGIIYVPILDICYPMVKGQDNSEYLDAHESEILIHRNAKKVFDRLGLKKLPKVKDLNQEYREILEKKKSAYAKYKAARAEMKEVLVAKSNMDQILQKGGKLRIEKLRKR